MSENVVEFEVIGQYYKGDKGDKGDTGPRGPKGDKGDKGDPGTNGIASVCGVKPDSSGNVPLTASKVGAATPTEVSAALSTAKKYADGKHAVLTVTLPVTGWVDNTQTVSVSGVTADNSVVVSSAPGNREEYGDAGIYCSAQDAGKLIFAASEAPTVDLTVNVLIAN